MRHSFSELHVSHVGPHFEHVLVIVSKKEPVGHSHKPDSALVKPCLHVKQLSIVEQVAQDESQLEQEFEPRLKKFPVRHSHVPSDFKPEFTAQVLH